MSKSKPTGIRRRHARNCKSKSCGCPWEAFVYLKRERKKLRKTFATQAEAKSWRADRLVAANRGTLRAPTGTTVWQAAEALMVGARDGSIPTTSGKRYKPSTLRGYRVALDKRLLPVLGDRRLGDVQRADVQDLADGMTAEGFSASTVHNTLDPLRVIYRRARRRDEVTHDPTEDLELRRPDGKRDRIASPAEAAKLIAAVDVEERALWATAFYAGLRRGELQALRAESIHLHERYIEAGRGWDAIEGEQEGKSEAADRRTPILDVLYPLLTAHLLRTGRRGSDLVFGRSAELPFNPETIRRNALVAWGWREVVERKDGKRRATLVKAREDALEPITLHEARHTCASLLIAAGVNPKALSTIMGHATIAMTFDTYGHLMPGGLDEAAAAANAYLASRTVAT
jgi:integrase